MTFSYFSFSIGSFFLHLFLLPIFLHAHTDHCGGVWHVGGRQQWQLGGDCAYHRAVSLCAGHATRVRGAGRIHCTGGINHRCGVCVCRKHTAMRAELVRKGHKEMTKRRRKKTEERRRRRKRNSCAPAVTPAPHSGLLLMLCSLLFSPYSSALPQDCGHLRAGAGMRDRWRL